LASFSKGSFGFLPPRACGTIIAAGKSLHIARALRSAEYIDVDLGGLADAGYGAEANRGHVTA
jgi:hypothetical protein